MFLLSHHNSVLYVYSVFGIFFLNQCLTSIVIPGQYYHKLLKIPPYTHTHLFFTLLWGKNGDWSFAQIFKSCHAYTSLCFFFLQSSTHARSTITTTVGSFDDCVIQEISSYCVHTKPRDIEAICIVSGGSGRSCVNSPFQCKPQKLSGG